MRTRAHFSRFFSADPERVHFAAHSHHYWPDVTLEAQERAWLDAARFADEKWGHVFRDVWSNAQAHVARVLSLPDPATVTFGPNTHDFLVRILSSLPRDRAHRVLTSDGEFHSFSRQIARLEEEGLANVSRVPCRPHATFIARWREAASRGGHDLAYVSHVFFDSGYAIDLDEAVRAIPGRDTVVVLDGYHGFCAVPTDLSRVASRAFYTAGGYKYAMSGEGVCFLHAPAGYVTRPRDTGWFAAFGALEKSQEGRALVPYADGGARMLGATFDPSGLYRFDAAMDWLVREAITVEKIHAHVHGLQRLFLAGLRDRGVRALPEEALLVPLAETSRGHFLTYELSDAARIHGALMKANVFTDVRGDRLRFGFAVYHDEEEIERGVTRIAAALA